MLKRFPPVHRRLGIPATDFMVLRGPFRSAPWVGDVVSAVGVPARRPSGVAPMNLPKGTFPETVLQDASQYPPLGPRP